MSRPTSRMSAVATTIPCTLEDIAPRVLEQLASTTTLPEERIVLVARDDIPHLFGEQDLLVRFLDWQATGPRKEGGGRQFMEVKQTCRVWVRTRVALESYSDRQFLLNATLGHHAMEVLVVDALDEFMPIKGQDHLCTEHFFLAPSSRTSRDTRPPEHERIFGRSAVDFTFAYQMLRKSGNTYTLPDQGASRSRVR